MALKPGVELSCTQKRKLKHFINDFRGKRGYWQALAIKMRGEDIWVNAVAE